MRTLKRKLFETAVVLGCLVGVIVIGASDNSQQIKVDENTNIEKEEYTLSEVNQEKSKDEQYNEYVQKILAERRKE